MNLNECHTHNNDRTCIKTKALANVSKIKV